MIGHFTAMIQDRTSRVGCALASHKVHPFTYLQFACNYNFNNILTEPVYKFGSVGSKCLTGMNSNYQGLCGDNEIVAADFDWYRQN